MNDKAIFPMTLASGGILCRGSADGKLVLSRMNASALSRE
jgi:hypothetical protein